MRFSLKTALVLFVIAAFAVSWFQAWRKLAVTRQLSTVTIEEFTDRKKFESRLGELVEIGFDDVDTSKRDSVAIASDRYRQQGLAIDAAGGLYASRTFSFPQQYPPVSGRNSVAVGPPGKNPGGTETDFLFVTGSEPGLVSAVGVTFVDADFPSSGASGLTANWPRQNRFKA
jgi:hypothetical protein